MIIRYQQIEPGDIENLSEFCSVQGTKSGAISGRIIKVSDKHTIHFIPDKPFRRAERITVHLTPKINSICQDTIYQFYTVTNPYSPSTLRLLSNESQDRVSLPAGWARRFYKNDNLDPVIINGISIPSDFPWVKITINDNPDPGYIFLNNWGGQPYNMILDNSGAPIWYRRTPDRRRDFKVQKNGALSMLVREGFGGENAHIALDSTYTIVDTMFAGYGYTTDEHEFQILPDGHYFLIGIRAETIDMSQYISGGNKNATVMVGAVQEFTPNHEPVLCVSAWDLFDIRDTEIDVISTTGSIIRFPHMNALDIDDDGHILISSRHLSEITKIHRLKGTIIWRFGGAHNQFTFIGDDALGGFRNQHDIRALGNNHYTLFDNGNMHSPAVSRAVEYILAKVVP